MINPQSIPQSNRILNQKKQKIFNASRVLDIKNSLEVGKKIYETTTDFNNFGEIY